MSARMTCFFTGPGCPFTVIGPESVTLDDTRRVFPKGFYARFPNGREMSVSHIVNLQWMAEHMRDEGVISLDLFRRIDGEETWTGYVVALGPNHDDEEDGEDPR